MRLFYALEALAFATAVSLSLTAIQCSRPVTPADQAATEAAYGAALLRCVDKSDTREQSESCREAVNEQYGRAADGGRK